MIRTLVPILASLLVLSACSAPPEASHDEPPMPEGLLASVESRERGGALFARHCALCHGERGDGKGVRRRLSKPAADLTDPEWRRRADPEAVYRAIHDGVPRTPMAAWRIFSEEETWAMVAYIMSLAEERGAGASGGDP